MTETGTSELDLAALSDTERRLVEFTRKLIATPSLSGEETAAGDLVASELKALGYRDVTIDEHGNIHGIIGDGRPRIMFNGHMDHVPPAGMDDPYGAQLVDASIYGEQGVAIRGRGACDMKGGVASGVYAAAFLDPSALRHGSYLFTADVKEEIDSPDGVEALLAAGLRADYGLSGESTELQVHLGHRGKLQFDLVVSGKSSHASTPSDGRNAVYRAMPFLRALEEFPGNLSSDPVYGAATVTVTKITSEPAGDVAVVPNACTIRIDRRYIPGETPESVQNELQELVTEVSRREEVAADLRLVNIYPLMEIEPEHDLVKQAVTAAEAVTGEKPAVRAWRFGVNGTFMSSAGIPTIGIGPGSEDWAHTSEEHILVQDLIEASRIYAELITQVCG
jgi:putative selenium metabolism hydrolase